VKQICGFDGAEEVCWIGLEEITDKYYGGTSWYWDDGSHTTYRNWDETAAVTEKRDFHAHVEEVETAVMNSKQLNRFEGTWFDAQEESGLYHSPICERPLKSLWRCTASSCYRRGTSKGTVEEAAEECASEGAHLVVISDEEENAFVQDVCGCRTCWIGLRLKTHSDNSAGQVCCTGCSASCSQTQSPSMSERFEWSDGSPVEWTNFARREPNMKVNYDGVVMNRFSEYYRKHCEDDPDRCEYGNTGKWHNDHVDDHTVVALCERANNQSIDESASCDADEWLLDSGACEPACAAFTAPPPTPPPTVPLRTSTSTTTTSLDVLLDNSRAIAAKGMFFIAFLARL
jgi:hypothetical protein